MTGLVRHWICDGDLTTAGGTVKATALGEKINGKERAYEGDLIECPTCKSTGHIKCVPPIRPAIGMDGRQKAMEGDLCICKCPTPPRLIASQTLSKAAFNVEEIASNQSALAWFSYAGNKHEDIGLTHSVRFHAVHKKDRPMTLTPYKITLSDGSEHQGVTDENGMTDKIYAKPNTTATMEIPYHDEQNNNINTTHVHTDCCSC
ncbi:hypothetical protein LINBF2_05540 [Limnohabitans sp. INBF002]|nr:hypothetical protein LINBF2_05540 [Limnohabitans sp. INBF002]